tara:strand:- start:690 stop:947 length:258 start_codon:yes stop_codon:yes gene_type:complete
MKTKEQELPKWFDGMVYKQGATVTNPFSGESYELNGMELSMYDFIMGCQMVEARGLMNNKVIKQFRKALDWFMVNNPEAYYVLLD